MTRIMLVNMPTRITEPAKHIPVGLAELAAVINQEGYEVAILDANCYRLSRELIRADLKEESAEKPFDIIGLSGMVTTYALQKDLIPYVKRDHPKTLLVAGGGCASSIPVEMMEWNPDLDMVVVGEAEKTILEIIKHLEDHEWSEVKGTFYRKNGELLRTEPQPLLTEKELDELPYPHWDLLPLEEVIEIPRVGVRPGYFASSSLPLSKESIFCKRRLPMLASRGCPYQCTYCADLLSGQSRSAFKGNYKIRYHSPKYVVDMMVKARFKYGIDFVNFYDECLTVNKKWVYEFCDLLEKADLPQYVKWGTTSHARTVTPGLLQKMRDAGCSYLDFGFESADDRMLKAIKKNSSAQRNQKALDVALDARITPITNFMIGFPDEDFESIMATTNFLIKNNIRCKPFFVTPFPMTELFETQKEKILAQYGGDLEKYIMDLDEATDLHANLTKFNDPELIGVQELISKHDVKRLERWHADVLLDDMPHMDEYWATGKL